MTDNRFSQEIQGAAADAIRWAFLASVEVLGATRATLLLRQGDDDVMRVVASVGMEAQKADSIRVRLGEGIAGIAAQRNMTFYGDREGTKYMVIPVARSNRVFGVLNVTNRRGDRDFGDADLQTARAMVEHLSYLLNNPGVQSFNAQSGLPDQLPFLDELEREVERGRRMASVFALALIRVPDLASLSQAVGDESAGAVFRGIGQALQKASRRYDVVGHLDVDTFAILFPGTTNVTQPTLSRFVDAISDVVKPVLGPPTVEVGLVYYPADGVGTRELLGRVRRRNDDPDDEADGSVRRLRPPSGA